ncbi:hypothetical protein F4861DRAFT_541176 [Xylaria intraflava]|nr:hypothetical protein F4861DRAFT_541176 [Xylaria intraflava]
MSHQSSWAQEATNRFFGGRKSTSQIECDEIARSISRASKVIPVDSPGSMSYTVVCNECPGLQQDLVVSFREPAAILDEGTVKLAKEIHGDLVPLQTYHGNVNATDPSLSIYAMPYLRGSSYIEVSYCEVKLDHNEEAKQKLYVKHLARYFARCWSNPQVVANQTKSRHEKEIRTRLIRLAEELPSSVLPKSVLPRLTENISSLFSQDYPQVLTHGDLSVTNILVDENKFEITGIVDWSSAKVMPFGMDLDVLFLSTGFMILDGWHDYACKSLLQDTFWEEFWAASGIQGEEDRGRIQGLAEVASEISAILRLTSWRNADGLPSEVCVKHLQAWFR